MFHAKHGSPLAGLSHVVAAVLCLAVWAAAAPLAEDEASADIKVISEAAAEAVDPGGEAVFEIEVKNLGPSPAEGVDVGLFWDGAGDLLESTEGLCDTVEGHFAVCPLGSIGSGQKKSLRVVFRAGQEGKVVVEAEADPSNLPDPNGENNGSRAEMPIRLADEPAGADIKVVLEAASDSVEAGGEAVFEALVKNLGPSTAEGVDLGFAWDGAGDFGSASHETCESSGEARGVCRLGRFEPGQSKSLRLVFEAGREGRLVVEAGADPSNVPDPNAENNSDRAVMEIEAPLPQTDLKLEMRAWDALLSAGDQADVGFLAVNQGDAAVEKPVLKVEFPESLDLLEVPQDCELVEGDLFCSLGELPPEAAHDLVLSFKVGPEADGRVTVFGRLQSERDDATPLDNKAQASLLVNAKADLQLSAEARPDPAVPGESLTFRLEVLNQGPSKAAFVQLFLKPPADLEVREFGGEESNCRQSEDGIKCIWPSLRPEESRVVELSVLVPSEGVEEGFLQLSAVLESQTDDPQGADNRVEKAVEVQDGEGEPSPAVGQSLVFPQSLASAGETFGKAFVGAALLNASLDDNLMRLSLLNSEGEPAGSDEKSLLPMAQEAFLADEPFPGAPAGVLQAEGLERPLKGFFLAGDQRRLDGVGDRLQEARELYLTGVQRHSSSRTLVFLHNPAGEAAAEVELILRSPQGLQLEARRLELPPRGSLLASLEQLFEPESGQEPDKASSPEEALEGGYLEVRSSHPLRGWRLGASAQSFEALAARPAREAERLHAPHFFADRGSGRTRLSLLNLEQADVTATVRALADGGELLSEASLRLSPGALQAFDPLELLDLDVPETGVLSGALEVSFNAPSRVLGSVSFGSSSTQSTLPLQPAGKTETLFLHIAQSSRGGVFTGLALRNVSDQPAEITLSVRNASGIKTAQAELRLEPGERLVDLLNGPALLGSSFEQSGGHLRIESSAELVAFALFGDLSLTYLSAIQGQ